MQNTIDYKRNYICIKYVLKQAYWVLNGNKYGLNGNKNSIKL